MTEISEAQAEFAKRQDERGTGGNEWTPTKPDPLPKTYTETTHHRSFIDRLLGRNKKPSEPTLPEGTSPAMPAAVTTQGESIHGIPNPNEAKTNQTETENLQSTGPANPEEKPDPLADKAASAYSEQPHQPDLSVDPNRPQPTVPGTRADYSGEWQPAEDNGQGEVNQGGNSGQTA